jgi:FAD/FMN-containing dehydrogenase
MVQVRSAGGAINDVPADATAYAHRHQQFSVTAISGRGDERFFAAWGALQPSMDGMYLSFQTDHSAEDVRRAFPPATLARLQRIKRRVDPDRVFVHNFDIGAEHVDLEEATS